MEKINKINIVGKKDSNNQDVLNSQTEKLKYLTIIKQYLTEKLRLAITIIGIITAVIVLFTAILPNIINNTIRGTGEQQQKNLKSFKNNSIDLDSGTKTIQSDKQMNLEIKDITFDVDNNPIHVQGQIASSDSTIKYAFLYLCINDKFSTEGKEIIFTPINNKKHLYSYSFNERLQVNVNSLQRENEIKTKISLKKENVHDCICENKNEACCTFTITNIIRH